MANNSLPYEIIAAPFQLYFAAVGTAFPLIDAAPSASWTLLGSSGNLNYKRDGVTVTHNQTLEPFRALGDMGVRKTFRTAEDQMIRVVLADLTLEQYRQAINSNTITTVAQAVGVSGHKKIGLSRGSAVATVALLVRGPSPHLEDGNMQYEVPRAAQSGNPEVVYRLGEPAGLALEWTTLVDPNAASEDERFGRLRVQTTEQGT